MYDGASVSVCNFRVKVATVPMPMKSLATYAGVLDVGPECPGLASTPWAVAAAVSAHVAAGSRMQQPMLSSNSRPQRVTCCEM